MIGNDGIAIPFGNASTPKVITLGTGLAGSKPYSVAQNTTKTLFDATTDLADFDCMIILSDQDVYLELTADQNATYGTQLFAPKVLAGVPFILGSDDAYANYTVNFGGGTVDVIDRVRVRNLGATTANVTCLTGT
jgi:hypothetical protein